VGLESYALFDNGLTGKGVGKISILRIGTGGADFQAY